MNSLIINDLIGLEFNIKQSFFQYHIEYTREEIRKSKRTELETQQQIETDTATIMMIGGIESGKSTIIKQMKVKR